MTPPYMKATVTLTMPYWMWEIMNPMPKLHKRTMDEIIAALNSVIPKPGPHPLTGVVVNYQLTSTENNPIANASLEIKTGEKTQVVKTDRNGMANVTISSLEKYGDIQITAKHSEYNDTVTEISI